MGNDMRHFAAALIVVTAFFGAATAQVSPETRMPPDILAMHHAAGGEIESDSRCEVLDWVLDPERDWPADAAELVETARYQRNACRLAHDDITPEIAAKRLNGETFRFDVEGNALTILARSDDGEVAFCCAPNGSLSRLGDSTYWAARYRLADLDRAMITLVPDSAAASSDAWRYYRGPNAPPQPAETPIGKWKGQMIERQLKSDALSETRRLMIYLPPGYSKGRAWPALFMTDAGAVEFAGLVEAMIAAGEIEPIVIVSADSGITGIIGQAPTGFGDLRAAEYLPGTPKGAARFPPHMTFFSEELVAYAVREFGVSTNAEDRAVAGESNGAVFALWAGIQKPDVFANAIAMSPGWKPIRPEDVEPSLQTRLFLSAGMYETPFIRSAQKSEASLKERGLPIQGRYYAAGHMHDQWAVALREALLQIFPPK